MHSLKQVTSPQFSISKIRVITFLTSQGSSEALTTMLDTYRCAMDARYYRSPANNVSPGQLLTLETRQLLIVWGCPIHGRMLMFHYLGEISALVQVTIKSAEWWEQDSNQELFDSKYIPLTTYTKILPVKTHSGHKKPFSSRTARNREMQNERKKKKQSKALQKTISRCGIY